MDNNKRKVSNIIMLLILFFMAFKQIIRYSEFTFIKSSAVMNDLVLLGIVTLLAVLLSITAIFLPLLIIVKFTFRIQLNLIPLPTIKQHYFIVLEIKRYRKRIFRELNVIRC